VILHTVNAYETSDKNKVVLHALKSEPRAKASYIIGYSTSFLHECVLDLESGETTECCLNPSLLVEFPVIDDRDIGKVADAVYCVDVATIGGPMTVRS
jgi:carotenoid cleavage dioxygenase-like enzyme